MALRFRHRRGDLLDVVSLISYDASVMNRWKYLIVPALLLTFTAIASACPMCKDSIPNSDAQAAGGLPSGFNDSVYLMLITFLSTLGLMVGIVVKGVRSTS